MMDTISLVTWRSLVRWVRVSIIIISQAWWRLSKISNSLKPPPSLHAIKWGKLIFKYKEKCNFMLQCFIENLTSIITYGSSFFLFKLHFSWLEDIILLTTAWIHTLSMLCTCKSKLYYLDYASLACTFSQSNSFGI